ncbi:MAG: aldose 1-epimerase family protein [Clostridiales bacterium]|jgi:hypothetical protein|nr:aldose 1-epimerase family protein [Clostridiales bacterium]
MKKSKLHLLRQYAGDLSGLYGMQDYTFNEGRAKGLRAIDMKNGRGLAATLLPDRCLDIPYCSYRGANLSLVLKPGLSAPAYYRAEGTRGFLRQFNGGLLTTCGLMNAGGPCEVNGQTHGLHGDIANTPGAGINKEELVDNDAIILQVSATMREACAFGEHMALHRKIRMETETNTIHICDEVENCGFEDAPLINLYHINFGYPLLDEGARVYFSTADVAPRDTVAQNELDTYHIIDPPTVNRPEACFIHTGGGGAQFGMLYNKTLGLAAIVHYTTDELPLFLQWKCMAAGEYALGLEPSAAGFWGLAYALQHGLIRYLPAGGTQSYHIRIEVLDDAIDADRAKTEAYIARCKEARR